MLCIDCKHCKKYLFPPSGAECRHKVNVIISDVNGAVRIRRHIEDCRSNYCKGTHWEPRIGLITKLKRWLRGGE